GPPSVDVAELRNDVHGDACSMGLLARPPDDRSIEVEAVDREAIASRSRQSPCESNLEVTGAGAHADKTAHSRRRAARRREFDPLWGRRAERSGEAASVGGVFASAGVVAALQMLLEEMIR